MKRSSSFSEGDRKGRRRGGGGGGGGAVKTTTTTTMFNQSRRRSKKVRSQTDVSRRRQSTTVAVPDTQPERRRRHKSYDADDEEAAATTGRLRVTFTRESRRYSDSESDRYESCDDDDDEYVSESDYGQSSSDDDDAIDNDWSPWITLAKRTNNALAAGGVVAVTPTTNSAQSNAVTETKKTVVGEVKRSKKGGFFRRLFGGDKKEKDVGNKKGGRDGTIGGRRPQRFPSPPKRKAPEIDPESRRKAIEVHVSGTRHEVVCREEEEESQQDQEREISKLDGNKRVAVVVEASRDDLDEILDSMSTSTVVSKTSSRMMSSKSQSPSPSNERSGRPVIVRVYNSKKSTSSAGGGGEVSPLAPAPRIPGPDPALVTSFKYVPGGSCPMTSTYVSDRSHVGKKLDFSISAAARNAGISPALLKKLCADSKEIDVQRSPSPQSRGRGDSSGTGSVETIIANPKYLKRTRSDLTSLDGFSDIPIYECRHEALVEENGVESRRRYGQRDAGSERDETRDGDHEDPDVVVVDDNDERRRSLMLRQRNLKSLVVGDDKPTTRGAGPPATMSTKIVIEDFDNDEGKAVQTSTWIKSQATIARRHRVARSSPPPYDDGKTIVSTTDSGYCSGDVKSPPSGRGGKASTDVIVPNSYRVRTSILI